MPIAPSSIGLLNGAVGLWNKIIVSKGRGFPLLATVLSFLADDRDTRESISLAGEVVEVPAVSRLRSDSGEAALDWALAGCGLVMHSWVDVKRHLHSGPSRPSSTGMAQRTSVRLRALPIEPSGADPLARVYRRHGGIARSERWLTYSGAPALRRGRDYSVLTFASRIPGP